MSEVKFKAWDTLKKKWISDGFAIDMVGKYVTDARDNVYSIGKRVMLCQYTGLKDAKRNVEFPYGKPIYDGDILKENCPRGFIYKVFSVPGGFAINQFHDDIKMDIPPFYSSIADQQTISFIQSWCEVIGNIYEKEYLLK